MVTNVYVNFTVRRLIFFLFFFFKGQDITWTQLLTLYGWDVGLDRTSPGLRCLHKLTYEHLHLTPALRMQVYMAIQVFENFSFPSKIRECFGVCFPGSSLFIQSIHVNKKTNLFSAVHMFNHVHQPTHPLVCVCLK